MKKLILFIIVLSSLSFGQYRRSAMEAWYNDVVEARISALINDSLSASGWQGTGLSDVDSIALSGEMRINGTVSYDQMLSIKNDAVNSKVQSWYNSRGTLLASVDSAGKFNSDTLTVDGNSRLGGLAAYGSRLSVENDAVNDYVQSWYNSRNTQLAYVDSSGKLNADTLTIDGNTRLGGLAAYGSRLSVENDAVNAIVASLYNSRNNALFQVDSSGIEYSIYAGVDSFTTTGAVDSVTLPQGSGLTHLSRAYITPLSPDYSTEVDTAIYAACVVVTGDGDPVLVVRRVKSYTGNGATAVKTGSQYAYYIKK